MSSLMRESRPNSEHSNALGPALRAAFSDPQSSPLGLYTSDAPSEVAVRRMWAKIQASEVQRARPWFARSALSWSMAGATLVVCLALLVIAGKYTLWKPAPLAFDDEGALTSGLNMESGDDGRTVRFGEGSNIELSPRSELGVVTNDGPAVVLALRRGKAVFSVTPGGPRKWTVDAGSLVVRVVGTVFSVERVGNATRVEVVRGVVSVSGALTGGDGGDIPSGGERGTVQLRAGQSVTSIGWSSRTAEVHSEPPRATGARDTIRESESNAGVEADVENDRVFSLDDLEEVADGLDDSEGLKAAPSANLKGDDTVTRLLDAADASRKLGHMTEAASSLKSAVLVAKSGDPRRALAALSFARISSDPRSVAYLLTLTIDEMPPGLREPSLGRLVTALIQSGQVERGRAFARTYLREFPAGPQLKYMEGLALK